MTAEVDRLVLVSPTAAQLADLDLPLTSSDLGGDCGSRPAAAPRSPAPTTRPRMVDTRFVPVRRGGGPAATLCFALPNPRGDDGTAQADDFGFGAAMATVPASADHPEVVALGIGSGFTNRRVDEESHAGLAAPRPGPLTAPRLVPAGDR